MKRELLQTTSPPWPVIAAQISQHTRQAFVPQSFSPVGGGCISQTFCIRSHNQQFFIKLNKARYLSMFEAEAAGLEAILNSASLRTPQPLCSGNNHDHAWLVLEFINLQNHGDAVALGAGLANMHRYTAETFGWIRDNTIGSPPRETPPPATGFRSGVNTGWVTS